MGGRVRSWTDEQLIEAVRTSFSYRAVIKKLRLIPAGGNYAQVQKRIAELRLDVAHFTGSRWNAGLRGYRTNLSKKIDELLVIDSNFQSFKLKKRLFQEGMKKPECEICGWAK